MYFEIAEALAEIGMSLTRTALDKKKSSEKFKHALPVNEQIL